MSFLCKCLASIATLGAAASVAGLGTFAAFTSTTNASNQVSTGTLDLALGAAGAATNRLNLDVSGLIPGASAYRAFDLRNTGSTAFQTLSLTTTATASSMLDTDTANGVQMKMTRCSAPWSENGSVPSVTYTCPGTTSTLIATRPVLGADLSLATLDLTPGATNHVMVELSLPTTADNTFQGRTSTLLYTFRATG